MDFGEFLRMKRTAKKMTIRQLALYAGCSSSYLSLLERGIIGERGPTPNFLRKLVQPLGVPYEVLMAAAGYKLQTDDELLYAGSLVMLLRESMGEGVEDFAKRVGMSILEINTLEQHGVSYETIQIIYRKLFGRQNALTDDQKKLFFRIEETLFMHPINSPRIEKLLHSILDFISRGTD